MTICEPWATVFDVCEPCLSDIEVDSDILDQSLEVASEILFNLSGRRWAGVCEDTIRPCARPSCGSGGCSCSGLSVIKLGPGLQEVTQVKLDGQVLVEGTDYRVDTHEDELVKLRTGVRQSWPCCQRLDLPDTELQTFSVTYTYGRTPPAGGVAAAAELGCQLALSCSGNECRLPERVQTVTRQGVTLALLDSMDLFDKGLTGLPAVDLWLRSVNPNGLSRRAKVLSPDTMANHRRVG